MAGGWAFEISIEYLGGGWSTPQVWYVAIGEKAAAEAELKKEIAFSSDTMKIEARGELSENALKGIHLDQGKVKQWI